MLLHSLIQVRLLRRFQDHRDASQSFSRGARQASHYWRLPSSKTLIKVGLRFVDRRHHLSHQTGSHLLVLGSVENRVAHAATVLDVVVETFVQIEQNVRLYLLDQRPKVAREAAPRRRIVHRKIAVQVGVLHHWCVARAGVEGRLVRSRNDIHDARAHPGIEQALSSYRTGAFVAVYTRDHDDGRAIYAGVDLVVRGRPARSAQQLSFWRWTDPPGIWR